MHPADALLLETFDAQAVRDILLLEADDGTLALALADAYPPLRIHTYTQDWRQFTAARERFAKHANVHLHDTVLPTDDQTFDAAMLHMPKGRAFSRMLMVAAHESLREDGAFYIAGPTQVGAKSAIADADALFSECELLDIKRRHRVARCVKHAATALPDWALQPGIAADTTHHYQVSLPQGTLDIATRPGVFSWDALDEGTALLLEHIHFQPNERVWDVGCGAGVIGLAAARAGAAEVAMSDVDLLAVKMAHANAHANGLAKRVRVFAADGITGEQGNRPWDLIVSNPAFHQGHDHDTDMADRLIHDAAAMLQPNGRLVIVANRFLPYRKLLKRHFKQLQTSAQNSRFTLWEASGD